MPAELHSEFHHRTALHITEMYAMTEAGMLTANRGGAADQPGFARARIGYKAPASIVVLDRLPLNATGKVDRAAIRALAEPGSA